ncbi:DUF3105 domain-containing protein [Candidatus Acetothermia bacterium]|nr:DUF3105 domain-containing protein [Candidatus Acetothermia bacterium]
MPKPKSARKSASSIKYIIGAAIVAVLAVAGYGIYVVMQPKSEVPQVPATSQYFPEQSREHIAAGADHPAYNSLPPTSGWHYASPAHWGVSGKPIPDELQVHNLEHGGIMIQYWPDLPAADVDKLKEIVYKLRDKYCKIILAPYPKLDKPIALTAWQRLDKFDTVDEARITAFVQEFIDKGPEKVMDSGC